MGCCRVIIGCLSEELIFSSFDNGWWFAEYKYVKYMCLIFSVLLLLL